jgi:hypothetical protein
MLVLKENYQGVKNHMEILSQVAISPKNSRKNSIGMFDKKPETRRLANS